MCCIWRGKGIKISNAISEFQCRDRLSSNNNLVMEPLIWSCNHLCCGRRVEDSLPYDAPTMCQTCKKLAKHGQTLCRHIQAHAKEHCMIFQCVECIRIQYVAFQMHGWTGLGKHNSTNKLSTWKRMRNAWKASFGALLAALAYRSWGFEHVSVRDMWPLSNIIIVTLLLNDKHSL